MFGDAIRRSSSVMLPAAVAACVVFLVLWRVAVYGGRAREAALERAHDVTRQQLARAERMLREGEDAWNTWKYEGADRASVLTVCDFPLSVCRSNEQVEVSLAIPDAVVSVEGDYALGASDRELLGLFGVLPGSAYTNAFAGIKGLALSAASPNPVVIDESSDIWDFDCPGHPLGFNAVSLTTEHKPGEASGTVDKVSGLRYCATEDEAFKFAKTLLGHLAAATGARISPLGEITRRSGKWAVDTRRVFLLVMLDNIVMPDGSPRHFVSLSIADKDSEHRGVISR